MRLTAQILAVAAATMALLTWGCSSSTSSGDGAGADAVDTAGAEGVCFCASNADCDDGNPCTVDLCSSGCSCEISKVPEDTECTPVNACLLPGKCHEGVCVSAGTIACEEEDGNPCTAPKCDSAAKSGEEPCKEFPEDDGTVISSYCSQRECLAGTVAATTPTPEAVACEQADSELDGEGCVQSMQCNDAEEACVDVDEPDGTPCFPGTDKCMGWACEAGECKQDPALDEVCEPPADCEDAQCLQCTEFKCDPKDGACKAGKLEGPCDDGDFCTEDDACQDASNPMYGLCKGTPKSCDDGKVCTVDECDPLDGHCVNAPKDENCPGSNNPCVSQLFCDPLATEASDPNLDGCVVVYKPAGTPCNDSDMCTTNEECKDSNGALLCLGAAVAADDGKPCTNDWCDPDLGPQHEPIPDCQESCTPGDEMQAECGSCGSTTSICSAAGWGPWSQCNDPCECECAGGTCCSNGCDYDNSGTSCGTCKQCNNSGSCSVNKPDGEACPTGVCKAGSCVGCANGEEAKCNPSCGVFDTASDGLKTCSNNKWGQCKAAWCVDSPSPVLYPVAPNDYEWHCAKVPTLDFYLCVKVVLSWICADYLEVDLMKSKDINGNVETGPWDNDIKVTLRNVATGATYSQAKVQCAGNTAADGGCFFDVGNETFTNVLGVQDFHQLEVDIYSPFSAAAPVGKTGMVTMQRCF